MLYRCCWYTHIQRVKNSRTRTPTAAREYIRLFCAFLFINSLHIFLFLRLLFFPLNLCGAGIVSSVLSLSLCVQVCAWEYTSINSLRSLAPCLCPAQTKCAVGFCFAQLFRLHHFLPLLFAWTFVSAQQRFIAPDWPNKRERPHRTHFTQHTSLINVICSLSHICSFSISYMLFLPLLHIGSVCVVFVCIDA